MTREPEPVLFPALRRLGRDRGGDLALVGREGRATYADLLAASEALVHSLSPARDKRVALVVEVSPAWVSTMAALDALAVSAFLVNPAATDGQVEELVRELGLHGVLRERGRLDLAGVSGTATQDGLDRLHSGSYVTLLTSGTTGKPKAVRHTWESLSRPVRVDPAFAGTRWLLAYPLQLYAGLQVFLQCFLNGGTMVVLPPGVTPEEICEHMLVNRVQYVSATPSFWRRLLSFGTLETLRRLEVRQITMGGEPATDELLRSLRQLFPGARLVHIYATSELGRCFSVTDGRAGFPASYLENPPENGLSLRIADGELSVRSRNRMITYDSGSGERAVTDDWLATGDLVEIVGDRVIFRGRRTDMINVGGNKVYPMEVETVIRQLDGVAEARAYAVPSSMVGEMVGVDVVAKPGAPVEGLRREVAALCARVLQPHQRPRQVNFVTRLELNEAGKIPRRKAGP